MKKVYWVLIALVIALGVSVIDGLRLRDKYSIAIGNYQAALDQSKKDGKALTLQIGELQQTVGQRDKEIAELTESIVVINTTIEVKNTTLVKLRATLAEAKTDAERVAILTAEVKVWSEKFSLAQMVIAEKDAIIADWAAKYDAQVTISESWKQKYEGETRLRTLAEKGWKASERRLRWTRIVGNVKSGLIVGALGYLGYSAIKGK
jgi:multidrug resistance efflux pump